MYFSQSLGMGTLTNLEVPVIRPQRLLRGKLPVPCEHSPRAEKGVCQESGFCLLVSPGAVLLHAGFGPDI